MDPRLAPVLNPLAYLARTGYRTLERVRDLRGTLERALAAVESDDPAIAQALAVVAAELPRLGDEVPTAERRAAVERCLLALGRVSPELAELKPRALESASAAAHTREPPREPAAAQEPPEPLLEPADDPRPKWREVAARARKAPAQAAEPALDGEGVERAQRSLARAMQYLQGVGPKTAEALGKRGVVTLGDALYFLPRRYEDRSRPLDLSGAVPQGAVTLEGEILALGATGRPGRGRRFEMVLGGPGARLTLTWFRVNAHAMQKRFRVGQQVVATGEVTRYGGKLQMVHPDLEPLAPGHHPEAGIVCHYPEVEGTHAKRVRQLMTRAIAVALPDVVDPLPEALRVKLALPTLRAALRELHQPQPGADLEALALRRTNAHRRLILDEFFLLELGVMLRKRGEAKEQGLVVPPFDALAWADSNLPFRLTGAQRRAVADVLKDFAAGAPMNRLVQGDVGSGKTAVCVVAAVALAQAGLQTAVMAPTEILAEQHFRTFRRLLQDKVEVTLFTGGMSAPVRRERLARVAQNDVPIAVGTHALLQKSVRMPRLGLVVVDEQHRFGVMQRATLRNKGREAIGVPPHVLVMTATPIPRTLAMTVYGDLDVSVIDELPPGRTPVKTRLFKQTQRDQVYAELDDALDAGRQVYVVYPLVEESEALDVRNATQMAEELRARFADHSVELLHGQMRSEVKEDVMRRFVAGAVKLLVTTTVVEVGVDVANATIMVIEHAERFGLSQLHQLRGRVGRGEHGSQCLLLAEWATDDAYRRLKVMERTHDGFVIAEEDLRIRGPGDFLGTRQSGLPDLCLGDLTADAPILVDARDAARAVLDVDPELAQHPLLLEQLKKSGAERLSLAKVG